MSTNEELVDLLKTMIEGSSSERKNQTMVMKESFNEIRTEMRAIRRDFIIMIGVSLLLMIVGSLARDGIFTEIGIPGVTIRATPAENATFPVAVEEKKSPFE